MNTTTPYTGLTTSLFDDPTEALVWPSFTLYPTPHELVLLKRKLDALTTAGNAFMDGLTEPTGALVSHGDAFPGGGYLVDRLPIALVAQIMYHALQMQRAWDDERYNDLVVHMRKLDGALRKMLKDTEHTEVIHIPPRLPVSQDARGLTAVPGA